MISRAVHDLLPVICLMWRAGIISTVIGAIIALIAVALLGVARTTTVEVDAISGSTRISNAWIGGHHSNSLKYDALARRLKSLKVDWRPDWRTINVNDYNLFGSTIARGCSLAPPIYQLHVVIDQFATDASPDQLRGFIKGMQDHSDEEQRIVVNQAVDFILDGATTNGLR